MFVSNRKQVPGDDGYKTPMPFLPLSRTHLKLDRGGPVLPVGRSDGELERVSDVDFSVGDRLRRVPRQTAAAAADALRQRDVFRHVVPRRVALLRLLRSLRSRSIRRFLRLILNVVEFRGEFFLEILDRVLMAN